MTRLLLTLALLLWATTAQAQFGTPVVTTSCANACGTTDDYNDNAMTVGISAATGDLIVVSTVHWRAGARVLSSAVCGGDTLTQLHTQGSRLWTFAVLATASRTTCTITLSGASTTGGDSLVALVVSGATDPLTETGTSAGASTAATTTHGSGTVTPGVAPVLFVGYASCNPAAEVAGDGTNFTNTLTDAGGGGGNNSAFGYYVQADTTAQSYDVTSVANESCQTSLVAIHGTSGGGGGGTPRRLTLLGVGR